MSKPEVDRPKFVSVFTVSASGWLDTIKSTITHVSEVADDGKVIKSEVKGAASISPPTKLQRQSSENVVSDVFPCTRCCLYFETSKLLRAHAQTPEHIATVQRTAAKGKRKQIHATNTAVTSNSSSSAKGSAIDTASPRESSSEEDEDWVRAPTVRSSTRFITFHCTDLLNVTCRKELLLSSSLLRGLSVASMHDKYWKALHKTSTVRCVCVVLLGGGRFSGGVFKGGVIQVQKTFHKYVTRKKQGGMQIHNDKGGSRAQSMGASIRRANYQLYVEQAGAQLQKWKSWFDKADVILVYAPGVHNQAILYKDTFLCKTDPRIRSVACRKPIFSEVQRVFDEVFTLKLTAPEAPVHEDSEEQEAVLSPHHHQQQSKLTVTDQKIARISSQQDAERRQLAAFALLVTENKVQLAKAVLEEGDSMSIAKTVNFRLISREMKTPLHLASERMDGTEMVRLLLENKADPTIRDVHNKTAFARARVQNREAFTTFAGQNPALFDYASADIPVITEEQKTAAQAKRKAKAKAKRQRQKAARQEAKRQQDELAEQNRADEVLQQALSHSMAQPHTAARRVQTTRINRTADRAKRAAALEARLKRLG
jgi:hypothetical protein